MIWIKVMRLSYDSYLMSTLYQSITTMYINDTTDDSGRNLMHKKMTEFVSDKTLKSPNMIRNLKIMMKVMMKIILNHLIIILLL